MVGNLVQAISITLWSLGIQFAGYAAAIVAGIVLIACLVALGLCALRASKKLIWE